jgi:hypothetical protein
MIALRHTTLSRTALTGWSAQLRDLYLTTYNTHKRQLSIPPRDSNSHPKRRAAAGSHLRPRGHWDRLCAYYSLQNMSMLSVLISGLVFFFCSSRKYYTAFLCLHRASIVSKTLFIIPTDAHYYKSVEMLKQFKNYNTCPDMFLLTQEPSSGSSSVLG